MWGVENKSREGCLLCDAFSPLPMTPSSLTSMKMEKERKISLLDGSQLFFVTVLLFLWPVLTNLLDCVSRIQEAGLSL